MKFLSTILSQIQKSNNSEVPFPENVFCEKVMGSMYDPAIINFTKLPENFSIDHFCWLNKDVLLKMDDLLQQIFKAWEENCKLNSDSGQYQVSARLLDKRCYHDYKFTLLLGLESHNDFLEIGFFHLNNDFFEDDVCFQTLGFNEYIYKNLPLLEEVFNDKNVLLYFNCDEHYSNLFTHGQSKVSTNLEAKTTLINTLSQFLTDNKNQPERVVALLSDLLIACNSMLCYDTSSEYIKNSFLNENSRVNLNLNFLNDGVRGLFDLSEVSFVLSSGHHNNSLFKAFNIELSIQPSNKVFEVMKNQINAELKNQIDFSQYEYLFQCKPINFSIILEANDSKLSIINIDNDLREFLTNIYYQNKSEIFNIFHRKTLFVQYLHQNISFKEDEKWLDLQTMIIKNHSDVVELLKHDCSIAETATLLLDIGLRKWSYFNGLSFEIDGITSSAYSWELSDLINAPNSWHDMECEIDYKFVTTRYCGEICEIPQCVIKINKPNEDMMKAFKALSALKNE